MAGKKPKSAAKGADSPRKRGKYKPRQPKQAERANPLPPPVEIELQQSPIVDGKPDPFSLRNLFTNQAQPQPETQAESQPSLTASYGDAGAIDERILTAVPEVIGETLPEPGQEVAGAADPVSSLMAMVAFEEDDVRDTLGELFDWLAERFKSEHWRLNERQARMLGKPGTLLANAMWAKLQAYLPDVLGKWCETTPGALAFLTACGIVIGPKVMQQVRISRERKAHVPVVRESPSHGPQPAHERTASGVIWSQGGTA